LNIFRLNWIFIDIIIIEILIFFLICVKIFKATHRWRNNFSNLALEQFSLKKIGLNLFFSNFKLRSINLTKNSLYKSSNLDLPNIVIIRAESSNKIINTITEGLSSYGYNIIRIKIKINYSQKKKIFEKEFQNEIKDFIISAMDFLKKKEFISNERFFLISISKAPFLFNDVITKDKKDFRIILINPKIKKIHQTYFSEISRLYNSKLNVLIIFSIKSRLIINNKNLITFQNLFLYEKPHFLELFTLAKARNSFKYYETILLGIIIDFLDKN